MTGWLGSQSTQHQEECLCQQHLHPPLSQSWVAHSCSLRLVSNLHHPFWIFRHFRRMMFLCRFTRQSELGAENKGVIALPSNHLCTWWDCGTPAAQGPALMACQLDRPDLLALSYRCVLQQPHGRLCSPGRHSAILTICSLPPTIRVLSHAGPCSQSLQNSKPRSLLTS